MNNKNSGLPQVLKRFTEERLKYAISAAETLDWAEANSVSGGDLHVFVAREGLLKSETYLKTVFEVIIQRDLQTCVKVLPHDVFRTEFEKVQRLVWEWRQNLLHEKGGTGEGFGKQIMKKRNCSRKEVVKELQSFLKDQQGETFRAPAELADLTRQYLPVFISASEVLQKNTYLEYCNQ